MIVDLKVINIWYDLTNMNKKTVCSAPLLEGHWWNWKCFGLCRPTNSAFLPKWGESWDRSMHMHVILHSLTFPSERSVLHFWINVTNPYGGLVHDRGREKCRKITMVRPKVGWIERTIMIRISQRWGIGACRLMVTPAAQQSRLSKILVHYTTSSSSKLVWYLQHQITWLKWSLWCKGYRRPIMWRVNATWVDRWILEEVVGILNAVPLVASVSRCSSAPLAEVQIRIVSCSRSCRSAWDKPAAPRSIQWILCTCSSIHTIVALDQEIIYIIIF